jgi:hypothetical protein
MKCIEKLWTKIVFFFGDIKRIRHFPFVTWDTTHHEIDLADAVAATKLIKPADIGLHRDKGFLSNWFISGCFKHAFIFTSSETTIEAISEGVVKRHSLYPIYSDYTIILRPKNLSDDDVLRAIVKSENIVGKEYDVNFAFDMEKTVKALEDKEAIQFKLLQL